MYWLVKSYDLCDGGGTINLFFSFSCSRFCEENLQQKWTQKKKPKQKKFYGLQCIYTLTIEITSK